MGRSIGHSLGIREHFSALLDHCPLPTLIVDRHTLEILASNDLVLAEPGTPAASVLGSDCTDRIRQLKPGQSAQAQISAEDPAALAALRPSSVCISSDAVDGAPVFVVTLTPAAESSRGSRRTPRLGATREALREQETRFRALADTVPVGIFLTNSDGRVMYVNDRWSAITGLTLNAAMVGGWLGGIHSDDRPRVQLAWKRFIEDAEPFDAEFRYVLGDSTSWVSARAVSFGNDEANRTGFLGTLVDITSRRQAEENLRRSEARYRNIFENVMDVYYETSLSGEILEVSPSIETLGGFTRDELLGKQMLGFYAKQSARGRLIEALMARGGVHDYEVELRDKNGQAVPCAISCKLERDEAGQPLKIIGSMRDIRQRKAAEEMLRAERQNLELIAEDVPLPRILESLIRTVESQAPGMFCSILVVDPDGKRLRVGAAPSLPAAYNQAVDGLEIEPNQGSCGRAAATKSCVIVEDIATSPYWTKFKDAALAHGLRACWSDPILGANGRLLGTLAMYYTQPGKPTKHQLQLIDAATRLAAVALERANAQQERKNLEVQMRQAQKLESLGVLAGGIAHDFNNLLTGIMGYASLASYTLRETDTAAARHVLEIEKVAQRAANLTKQMLAYSGKGRFLVAPLDLGNLVDELARLLEISISKKARIHYSFSPNLPPIEADAAQVQQVVMNLITNASEALHDQPGDIRIETGVVNAKRDYLAGPYIDAELPEGRYVYVDVTDTGCGMDEETLARIFDPFYTTKFTGRGLGMSAVLGIMRGHRGTIKIESQPGAGTTVRLLFPVTEKQPIEPVETWSNRVLRREDTPAHGTVLIVDDEELVRALAAAILAEAGYRVLTAVDGEQALEVCSRHANEIDLILLDLMMPNRDGVETLRELRARGSSIPVILSSGYSELEVAKRVNGDRFEAFVQKPYTRDVILAAIERVLIDP